METVEDIAVVLLAAGLSRRFGDKDKLEQRLAGKPLALHAGGTLANLPFGQRIAVCAAASGLVPEGLQALGFQIVVNPNPTRGQGTSLALGARAAEEAGASALLVALADMPYVSEATFAALVLAWRSDAEKSVATRAHDYRGVPAVFPRRCFAALAGLGGERGAKALLADALLVEVGADELKDFDQPEDFRAAEER